MTKYEWLIWVGLAGLSWGTYVPLIFYGGSELGGKPASRILAILCVGVAYVLIGVIFPLVYLFALTPAEQRPEPNGLGLLFSGLAGAAGALGAICVIFATKSAIAAARFVAQEGGTAVNYKLYIAPLIFGLAPVINTLVSVVWHPKSGQPFHFALVVPGWKLWLGIFLVGAGAALVLYSKEQAEAVHPPAKGPAAVAATPSPQPAPETSP
jgi:hypothetical protein